MKLLACWHIGKAKNAPFKLLLTTASARVAAELAPLCAELTFKGDVRRKMKGLESLITGWHRRSYFGCVSSLWEISTQGHETKITGTKGNEREMLYFCSDFPQTASPASRSPWFELVAEKKIRHSGTLTADFPANFQLPTLCDLNSLHSFADSYPEATMKETLCGGGCKAGMWEGTASSGCPDGTSSPKGHRLVSGENHCSREVSRMVEVGMGQRSQKRRWAEPSGLLSIDGIRGVMVGRKCVSRNGHCAWGRRKVLRTKS